LSLGGQMLPIESSDGPLDRQLDDGTNEIVYPALANSGFVGEVRLRYRPEVAAPGFAWDILGVSLLGSLSLVVLAWWIVHHWVLQLGRTIESVRAIGTDSGAFELGGRGAVLGDLSSAAREVHAAIDEERRRAREAGLELARRLVRSLEQRGLAITGHGERTRRYALLLAEAIELPADEWNDLGVAASLVDLGKSAVRASALGKGPSMTDVERESLRFAPARAASFLAGLPLTDAIAAAIKHHREKWDGSGFPDGLRGDRIPLLARIVSIADAYDLLTSDHEQCEALRWPDALDRLHEDRGEHFDPTLLDLFEAAIRKNPTPAPTSGSVVLAATRRSAATCLPYKITDDLVAEADDVEEFSIEDLTTGAEAEFEVLRDEHDAEEESRS
ncbi:MAG: HD domain-containing protein, partial [Planctomycetes bacterium]|nr:HD domain-containing protein [Planctomycetota bacterium]